MAKTKKRRWVKKGAKKTKGWKKTGKTRFKKKEHEEYRIASFPNRKFCFPEILRTTMTLRYASTMGSSTGQIQSVTFNGSTFGDGTTNVNGCGPQINWAGAFGKNYPSGHRYLCSTPLAVGSAAPYSYYRVLRSKCSIKVSPIDFAETVGGLLPSPYIRVFILPSEIVSFSGMPVNTVAEQPFCRDYSVPNPMVLVPAVRNVATSVWVTQASSIPKWQAVTTWVHKLLGVPMLAIRDENDYRSTPSSASAKGTFYHLITSGDGVNSYDVEYDIKIEYDVEYFSINNIDSTQNV